MMPSQSQVLRVYMSVIEDVINAVRECFLDEGVDEQVLQELKQTWEAKIQSNKAIGVDDPDTPAVRSGVKMNKPVQEPAPAAVAPLFTNDDRHEKLYPVQITLPAQQNTGETGTRVLTIHVPESAIAGNQLQSVLTGPVIGATLSLPTPLATSLLQNHVNATLRGQQTGSLIASRPFAQQSVNTPQLDGCFDTDSSEPSQSCSSTSRLVTPFLASKFMDGAQDSSDDDDDDDDYDDDDVDGDDAENDGEDGEDNEGAEEEPLNSGDDVSEEDVTDLFDTDNVVVCQYDKITRSRNKWKFYLKDGVMNLQGKDFVFQKSNGDAEW